MLKASEGLVFLALVVGLAPTPMLEAQPLRKVRIGDEVLRKRATRAMKPQFPETSLRRKASGVAVAQVDISDTGEVNSVKVLQAPDPETAASMQAALKKWLFTPVTIDQKPLLMSGKVIFYFLIENGKGLVLSPAEVKERREKTKR
ncbi:MAG: energy transducer TonB [Acidobacteriota bacterium]